MKQADSDQLRARMVPPRRHLVAGRAAKSRNGERMHVVSPIDGRGVTTLADGGVHEIDAAVAAAREVCENRVWSRRAPVGRKRTLLAFAELIEANGLEPAVLGMRDSGTEIGMAYKAEPLSAAATPRWYGEAIDKVCGEVAPTAPEFLARVRREPLGVVGVIMPGNFPLMIGAWTIAPALAAGNSVVVKPSKIASRSLRRLAELAREAELPEEVFDVVTGRGAGAALAAHADVDVLASTGSGATDRHRLEASARSTLKGVHLELGGKSANIVCADAPDPKAATKVSAQGIFPNAGEVGVASSRLLVEPTIHDDFPLEIARCASAMTVGDPLRLDTGTSAVAGEAQIPRNLDFVAGAKAEGAHLVCGGQRILKKSDATHMAPTAVADGAPAARRFQEEAFGSILAVTPFDDEGDAIRLANATPHVLAGAGTTNPPRPHRIVSAMRAGGVHVNAHGGADVTVPLGGFGQSGFGRDKSLSAFEGYTDLTTAWIAL